MPAGPTVGEVVAVCSSPRGGVPKRPQERIVLNAYGVEGDYHAGPTRVNRRGETEPNRRQVTVVSKEVIEALERELGCAIPHGGFGENILVRGLGHLAWLEEGDVLEFGGGAAIEITGHNNPCANLQVWHPDMVKAAYGRRGVLAVVTRTGTIVPGERVTVRRHAPSPS
ncbi:MAG TPA: MOSC domain-containing protein [Dehalococcoidia bacterium]|nr:MOSC domain-containing protein [Dehalococcoidia bacterium]